MAEKTDVANTPYYVLRNGNQPIYPTIKFDDPERNCVCVYGFSSKSIYDKFVKNAGKPLTPYPLVDGYLSNQLAAMNSAETNSNCLRLVILDATDLAQPILLAAEMAAVLTAHQEKSKQVPIEFELVFDPETAEYRFNDDFEPLSTPVPKYVGSKF